MASPRGGTTYLTMMMTMTRIMMMVMTRMMMMVIMMMTMTRIMMMVMLMTIKTGMMKMVVLMSAGTTYVTAKETSQLKEVHIEAAIPCEMKLYM